MSSESGGQLGSGNSECGSRKSEYRGRMTENRDQIIEDGKKVSGAGCQSSRWSRSGQFDQK
jgi:hypothetical protein